MSRHRTSSTRAPIDTLEPRRLFAVGSANIYFISGEIIVNGSDKIDTISVLPANGQPTTYDVVVKTGKTIKRQFVNAAQVTKITLNGRDGDDTISLQEIAGVVRLHTVDAGAGNDAVTIFTTTGQNVVTGGYGADRINILGGASSIRLKDGSIDIVTAPSTGTYIKNKDSRDRITLI